MSVLLFLVVAAIKKEHASRHFDHDMHELLRAIFAKAAPSILNSISSPLQEMHKAFLSSKVTICVLIVVQ